MAVRRVLWCRICKRKTRTIMWSAMYYDPMWTCCACGTFDNGETYRTLDGRRKRENSFEIKRLNVRWIGGITMRQFKDYLHEEIHTLSLRHPNDGAKGGWGMSNPTRICAFCKKEFQDRQSRRQHQFDAHEKPRPVKVEIINKGCDGKDRWPDEISAKIKIAKILSSRGPERDKYPCRAYFCPNCKGWHLTSKPRRSVS